MKRALVVLLLVACGPKAVFRLSSDENNPYALREALAKRKLPAQPTPVNASGKPRVFALVAGNPKTIVAFDLITGNTMWKVDADVQSRIAVGGDFIVALEGKQLVAHDQGSGAVRWRASIPGTLVGAAADRERAYAVYKDGSSFGLAGYDGGSGKQLWKSEAAGQLGAPAANGGLVYVPFLSQWLSIVDGRNGDQLTRVRGLDEQISTLRATSQALYYGSKQGVFELDPRSATGKRDQSTYAKVNVPAQLERTSYGRDAYDATQLAYTAADRTRVLWTSVPTQDGPMQLANGYVVHYFRFVFGFEPSGVVRWAYSHPRVELVASEHTGGAIAGISSTGEIVALDPASGAVRAKQSLGTTQPVLGATFDADGWAGGSTNEAANTDEALISIARDHDARFDRVKELAVIALAARESPEVTAQLLGVLADKRAPARLKDVVVELLVARKDPKSLAALTAQLAVHTDFLAQTTPDALGPVAKAIAGLKGLALDAKDVTAALAALESHLAAPTTETADLVHVIEAMSAIGGGAERGTLGSHLLLYHSDEDLGNDPSWQGAIVAALAHAGPGERVLLRHVAADARTRTGLGDKIREAVGD